MQEKENRKKLTVSLILCFFMIVILAVTLSTATYAWFTFDPSTNVTPIASSISEGDVNFLISNDDVNFDVSCDLIYMGESVSLDPISTVDMVSFYKATAQTRDGISCRFADARDEVDDSTIHGLLYVKCDRSCDVYLNLSGLTIKSNVQTLASLRLALKITVNGETKTVIYRLDDFADVSGAEDRLTVEKDQTVIESIDEAGNAVFTADPSVSVNTNACRTENGAVLPVGSPLFSLDEDPKAEIEFWLYLEGCDRNCEGEVQKQDVSFALAFAATEK